VARSRRDILSGTARTHEASIGLLGLPFDANSSFRRGPAKAPASIRTALASASGNAFSETGVRVWPSEHVVDLGDAAIPPLAGEREPLDAIERAVYSALARVSRLIVLGGDHAVTYPVIRAIAQHRRPLHLLQIDAHPDLYPDFEGNRYSHACPMARIMEEGLVERLVQVGIRSVSPAQRVMAERYGVETIAASDVDPRSPLVFTAPLYLSLDLDGLDPAFVPGVSHPEPGGLSVREVLDLLARVQTPDWVGADVVELNPDCDPTGMSATVAAKMVREIAALMLARAGE